MAELGSVYEKGVPNMNKKQIKDNKIVYPLDKDR